MSAVIERLVDEVVALRSRVAHLESLEMPSAGAWTAFTPTVTQGVGVTISVTYARYCVIGKLVLVQFRLGIQSAGTAGNAIVVNGLPVAAKNSGNNEDACGSAIHTGIAGSNYAMTPLLLASTSISFIASGGSSYFGIGPAVTLANGHALGADLMYEAA